MKAEYDMTKAKRGALNRTRRRKILREELRAA